MTNPASTARPTNSGTVLLANSSAPRCKGERCRQPLPAGSHPARRWCSPECRKLHLYSRPCPECGTPMSGSNGNGPRAPQRCARCAPRRRAKWTRELVLARVREWAELYGRAPSAAEWSPAQARLRGTYKDALRVRQAAPGYWPCTTTVRNLYGSWNAAMVAAQLEPRRQGYNGDREVLRPVTTHRHLQEAA